MTAASDPKARVTYGQLANGQKIVRKLDGKAAVKAVSEFRVMGKPAKRRDARAKVTGKALYAGDVRLPGMLYAKVLRPPAHGATLKSVDTAAAARVPGPSSSTRAVSSPCSRPTPRPRRRASRS